MKRNSKLKLPGVSTRRPQDLPEPTRRKAPPAPVEDELPPEPEQAQDDDEDDDEEPAEHREADDHGPDDALGLYLREMGAIPLLNRDEELRLAKRLERARDRYRHAALLCPGILQRLHATFSRIHQGHFHIDPTIEVVNSLGLTRESILKRLPLHLRTLAHLLRQHDAAFNDYLKATSARVRHALRRKRWRILRKAA